LSQCCYRCNSKHHKPLESIKPNSSPITFF